MRIFSLTAIIVCLLMIISGGAFLNAYPGVFNPLIKKPETCLIFPVRAQISTVHPYTLFSPKERIMPPDLTQETALKVNIDRPVLNRTYSAEIPCLQGQPPPASSHIIVVC